MSRVTHPTDSRGGGYPAAAALLAAAAWAMLVPYLGSAWELTVGVPARAR